MDNSQIENTYRGYQIYNVNTENYFLYLLYKFDILPNSYKKCSKIIQLNNKY